MRIEKPPGWIGEVMRREYNLFYYDSIETGDFDRLKKQFLKLEQETKVPNTSLVKWYFIHKDELAEE